jgi:hypothetical protein
MKVSTSGQEVYDCYRLVWFQRLIYASRYSHCLPETSLITAGPGRTATHIPSIKLSIPTPVSVTLLSSDSESLAPSHPVEPVDSLRPVPCDPAEQPVICKTEIEVNLNLQKI